MIKVVVTGCACLVAIDFVTSAFKRIVCRVLRPPGVDKLIAFDDLCYRCNGETTCTKKHCSEHNIEKIVQVLDSAKVSMDLCLYMLSSLDLMNAIKRAHERGVDVRIVADHDMAFNQGSKIFMLQDNGVKVKSKASTKLMHHKFCIIDSPTRVTVSSASNTRLSLSRRLFLRLVGNPHRGLLVTGSMNWTQQAMNGNWEHILVTSHLPLLNSFQEEFDHLWESFPDFKAFG